MSQTRTPLQRLWHITLDIIYPPRCGGCDTRNTLLCDPCRATIKPPSLGTIIVPDIDEIWCAGIFGGPLREAIHKLKYQSDTPLAAPLADLLVGVLTPENLPAELDENAPVIMPVPLHKQRERMRGFNQCTLIAERISEARGWPMSHSLVRVRATKAQVGLKSEERKQNVQGAFEWQGDKPPTHVVLVDDVCTTGITLAECGLALRHAGVKNVYAAIVAKAAGFGPKAGQ